jgi:hypothetical protein
MEEKNQFEIYAEMKEEGKARKKYNRQNSIRILEEKGIPYKLLSEGAGHYRVGDWNFWPSTGKFHNIKTGKVGRGVFNLIKLLN